MPASHRSQTLGACSTWFRCKADCSSDSRTAWEVPGKGGGLCVDGISTGAVRVSVGIVSNFRDVWKFVEFAKGFVE